LIYLAIFDFVPNIAFLIGLVYLVKIMRLKCSDACVKLSVIGGSLILIGGVSQAIWKILFITGTADIRLLSNLQFILIAPGFVILFVSVILLARLSDRRISTPLLALALWKIPFLVIMVVASLGTMALLFIISFRRRAIAASFGFAAAFFLLLALGGMAGGEQTIGQQWAEETVNASGEIAFALGCYLLYRKTVSFTCKMGGEYEGFL